MKYLMILILILISKSSFSEEFKTMKSVRINSIAHDIKYNERFIKIDKNEFLSKLKSRGYNSDPFVFEGKGELNKYLILFFSAKNLNGSYHDDSLGYFTIRGEFSNKYFIDSNKRNFQDFLYFFDMKPMAETEMVSFLEGVLFNGFNSIVSDNIILRVQAAISPEKDIAIDDYLVRYTVYVYKK